ncbi:MAG: SDR family NAD(P)-dependent oxidoreductase [Gemmatimonadales bacterium]
MELKGKVALVTGAGRRLGSAIALALAERGATVAIHHHHSTQGAEKVRADILARGGTAERFAADLTDPHTAQDLPREVVERFGRLDVLVNSAAVMKRLAVEETTPVEWDEIMNLNLRAYFFCVQGALPALRAARGKVVNLADVGGLEPWPKYAAHCISKAGVIMLTKTLARALAPEVTVNAVAPGAALVPESWDQASRDHLAQTTPLGRLGTPGDITAAILYLLEGGDYVTGETIVVDGGRLIR